MHACIHTYIHTYIHTCMNARASLPLAGALAAARTPRRRRSAWALRWLAATAAAALLDWRESRPARSDHHRRRRHHHHYHHHHHHHHHHHRHRHRYCHHYHHCHSLPLVGTVAQRTLVKTFRHLCTWGKPSEDFKWSRWISPHAPKTISMAYPPGDAGTVTSGHGNRPRTEARPLGDRIFRESSVPVNAQVSGSGKATVIWSFRHCKSAACILGLTGANMRLSLMCGSP